MRLPSIHLICGRVLISKLKIRKVDGYWNYDKSEFADSVELLDSDEEREKAPIQLIS